MISVSPAAKDGSDLSIHDSRAIGASNTRTDVSLPPSRPVHPASLKLRSPIARRILEAGPGDPSDAEQVWCATTT